ncbi:MAG: type II toxin-antitoxin system MqsA family antitoxin [Actinomycetota bacterium]
MRCVICKQGEALPGTATITLSRGDTTIVVKGVSARVCENCGEEYVDQEVTEGLLHFAEEAVERGVEIDVRQYVA